MVPESAFANIILSASAAAASSLQIPAIQFQFYTCTPWIYNVAIMQKVGAPRFYSNYWPLHLLHTSVLDFIVL
jgi:hypothetical protein